LSIYIYGLWVKLLFPKGLHIRNERRKWGRERELRKEEDGQAARRKKKKHQRELAIMQNDLLGPQLAVNHSGLIFIFSLLLYSFHVMGFSFSKSFSAPRESPEILILRHDKKEKEN
jgi:hypothetical protein